jgi:hypothetical protein
VTEQPAISSSRAKVNKYTASPLIALSTYVFLSTVCFLPGTPNEPLLAALIALGLGLSALRSPQWASGALSLFVFVTIIWQLIGFGLFSLFQTWMGYFFFAFIILILSGSLFSAKVEPASMALAVMAVALMLTPYYYLSIAMIVAAAAVYGLSSIGPVSTTFICTLLPLLILENGIYYARVHSIKPPIIFSQLSHLSQNLAPSLTGLNIFLTGLPTESLTKYASSVVEFIIKGYVDVLIVPVCLLGIVFSSSASLAGIVNSFLSTFTSLEKVSDLVKSIPPLAYFSKRGDLTKIASPLVAAIVAPLAFVALINVLAGPGGYQTALSTNQADVLNLLSGALAAGIIFSAREFMVQRMERIEMARIQLIALLNSVKDSIKKVREIAEKISKGAPTVDTRAETRTLDEYQSLITDIERGMGTAGYEPLTQWIFDLQRRVLPSLEKMPEIFRIKVINELSSIAALILAYNNMLEESRSTVRFPSIGTVDGLLSVEEAVKKCLYLNIEVKKAATKSFEEYVAATSAFNFLTGREELIPPVNVSYLFDSGDYVTGMRLIAEEYWLNFRSTHKEEMEDMIRNLTSKMSELEGFLDQPMRKRVETLLDSMSSAEPACSAQYLNGAKELSSILSTVIEEWRTNSEQLEKLMKSLTPGATKVVHFESIDQSSKLQSLLEELHDMKVTFLNLTKFIDKTISILSSQREKRNVDEQNLIVLSQYPVARKVIEEMTKGKKKIPIVELPFHHEAALVFVKLFTLANRWAKFDYSNEVLVIEHA